MNVSRRRLTLGATLLLAAACGGDGTGPAVPPPLEITSVTPAADASEVETGARVEVVFNQAIDPATLTAETFRVKRAGEALPVAVSYEEATRTATAAAPLVPGVDYEAEVTTGVRTPADSALAAPAVWSFGTRVWQAVTVDAGGDVGRYTSLARDGSGRLHVSYRDKTNGDLKYATCATGCEAAASWQTVTVDAAGDVGRFTSLAVDGTGRLHVSYFDETDRDLMYATCASDCATAASWQAVTADAGGAGSVGTFTSLTVDGSGGVHVSYLDGAADDLKYATCAADCQEAASWDAVTVDADGAVGSSPSVAVDASGVLHVSYHDIDNGDLKYATCAADCAMAASWQKITVDEAGNVGRYTSLAVDAGGRVHVGYLDLTSGDLKYASCPADCAGTTSWQAVTVDNSDGAVGFFTSLAVDGNGRIHVGYYDGLDADLKYATCAADCQEAGNWDAVTVDAAGAVGTYTSLAVDADGRLHVSYRDGGNGDLKYIE